MCNKKNDTELMQIDSNNFKEVTTFARDLDFPGDYTCYVSPFVWDSYVIWKGDDFSIHQTEKERLQMILKGTFHCFSDNGVSELPGKELFFRQKVLVYTQKGEVELELVLFRINAVINEQQKQCLLIDAVLFN